MTGRLELPNAAFTPTGFYKPKYLQPADRLIRVARRSTSFGPCDWNTSRQPMGVAIDGVGRLDPTPTDDFDFLYGAECCASQAVALQETLRGKLRRSATGQRVLDFAELECRSIVTFRVPCRLSLIDIRRQEGREHFGADEELLYSDERDKTRAWCEYIRRHAPDGVTGMAYNSTQETAQLGAASFILWQDPADHLFEPEILRSVDLGSSDGQDLVMRAFAGFSLLIT